MNRAVRTWREIIAIAMRLKQIKNKKILAWGRQERHLRMPDLLFVSTS